MCRLRFALACCGFIVLHSALPEAAHAAPPPKVGQIIVVGNEITRDDVIRTALGLSPGQIICDVDLRAAEQNLAKLGLFALDPKQGIRPAVTVVAGEGEFKDVLVNVRETYTGGWKIRPGLSWNGGFVLRLIVDERNFDPCRLPTHLDDILERRAFRGGGMKLRLNVLELPVSPSVFIGFLLIERVTGRPLTPDF